MTGTGARAVRADRTPGRAAAPLMGHRAARGFAWLLAQSLVERVVTVLGQLVLAWLLLPKDFELVALTYTVTTFTALAQQAGIREILVQRHRRFDVWATPAFWLSLALGVGAGIVTAAAGPLVASPSWYGRPELVGLLFAASFTLPLTALQTAPEALLRAHMRFRVLSIVGLVVALTTTGSSLLLAWRGFGAYSFILAQPIAAAVRLALLWAAARPVIERRLHLRRWRFFLADSALLLIATMAMMATYQGDYITLGRLYRDQPLVGIYYFAFMLSAQPSMLLVFNLAPVLFPALRSLKEDPLRQARGFLKATSALMLVGMPVCLLQAALAGPFVRVFFPERLHTAIPLVAVLSFILIGRLPFGLAESMLLAQRRQRRYMLMSLAYALIFLTLVYLGAKSWASVGAAGAVVLCVNVLGPLSLKMAAGPSGSIWRDVWGVYRVPLIAGALSVGPAAALRLLLPAGRFGDLAALALVSSVGGVLYLVLVRALARAEWEDLSSRIRSMLGRG